MSDVSPLKHRCLLIASVSGDTPPAMVRRMESTDRRADLIELRLDRISGGQVAGLVGRAPLPVVAACRRREDGGTFEGDEIDRQSRLRAAAQAGASWIDVEWGSDLARSSATFSPARVILSWHDFSSTPSDLGEKLRAIRSIPGASLIKLVPTARRLSDLQRLRAVIDGAGDLIAFSMGTTGAASRLLAPAWGSRASYAAGADEPTGAGQFSVRAMLDEYRFRDVGRSTRVAGLLGHPLGHSFSPRLHNMAYGALGLDWVYVPFESESVEDLREMMLPLGVEGASVTIPHKRSVLSHMDQVDPLARRLGAVNTIVRRGQTLHGFNTDAAAAVAPLRAARPLAGQRVALLGAGGAARALAFTLPAEGCRVKIFNRTAERAADLAAETGAEWGRLEDLSREPYDILIQTTPVGMHPAEEEVPIPEEWLRGSLVYDIIYNPPETRLLRAARRRGIRTLSGREMFVEQAAAQFRLFTGSEPPLGEWREGLASVGGGGGA